MVVTDDDTLHDRMVHFKGQGLAKYREYWHDVIGYNYRMTNICAAIGLAQLEQADSFIAKKRQIATWYRRELRDLPVTFQEEAGDVRHSYWMVSIPCEAHYRRMELRHAHYFIPCIVCQCIPQPFSATRLRKTSAGEVLICPAILAWTSRPYKKYAPRSEITLLRQPSIQLKRSEQTSDEFTVDKDYSTHCYIG